MNLNLTDYVSIKTNISPNKLHKLVDSQADISIVKSSSLHGETEIDDTEIIEIKGVTKIPILILGTIFLKLYVGKGSNERRFIQVEGAPIRAQYSTKFFFTYDGYWLFRFATRKSISLH